MFIVPILIVKQKQLIEGHWHWRNTWLKTTEVRLIKIISLHFNTSIKYIFRLTSDLIVLQESDDSTLRKSGNRDSADDFTRYHRLDITSPTYFSPGDIN